MSGVLVGTALALLWGGVTTAGADSFSQLMVVDAQAERAQSNQDYWEGVQAAGLPAAQREFRAQRIQKLQALSERKNSERLRKSSIVLSGGPAAQRALTRTYMNSLSTLERVNATLERSRASADSLLNERGYWGGPTYLSPFLTAEYILCLKVLNRLDSSTARKAQAYLLRVQKDDGSFGAWDTGPSDATITHGGMTALKAINTPEARAGAEKARQWIIANHAEGKTLFTVQLMAGMLGWEKFEFNPAMLNLASAWNIPKYGIKHWSSWIRALAVPLSIMMGIGHPDGTPKPKLGHFKKRALRKLVELLKGLTDDSGHLYISNTTAVMGILAYNELTRQGYGGFNDKVEAGFEFIRKYLLEDRGDELLIKNPASYNWDTPNMLVGIMGDDGKDVAPESYARTLDFLYDHQVLDTRGEWAMRSPEVRPGGWGTVPDNRKNPDTEGTGQVLISLRAAGRNDAASVNSHIRAVEWLLGLQGDQGGWATFEKNVTPKKPGPMRADAPVNELFKLRKYPEQGRYWAFLVGGAAMIAQLQKDMVLLVDYPFADLTGHVVEGISAFGYTVDDEPVKNALNFIRNDLGDLPVWFSRYGIDYYWGTLGAIRAFLASGANLDRKFIRDAVSWVKQHQNSDGGWGQDYRAVRDFRYAGRGRNSVPSVTSQALMILLAAGEGLSPQAKAAAEFLMAAQRSDGRWIESEPNCWAGGVYMVDYTYLPQYLSMVALSRYRDEVQRAGRILTQ